MANQIMHSRKHHAFTEHRALQRRDDCEREFNCNRTRVFFLFVEVPDEEFANLKSQFVISSWGGIRRGRPCAFTEQGVAMLSSVLRSKRAVQVNIEIMRAFVRVREILVIL